MLSQIPQNRLLLYLMLLGALPLLFSIAYFFSNQSEITYLKKFIEDTQSQAFLQARRQANNKAVSHHFKDADRFYIDKQLEQLTFLKPEIQSLKEVMENKNYAGDDTVRKRFDFLTGSANKLLFSEGVVDTLPGFQETVVTQVHPVEVDASDIATILSLIEGQKIGKHEPAPNRPQLILIDFNLEKKALANKNEIFTINMKLLKREIL
ncbi:hypothetical protein [Parachlamydia sp. AcF125]|uniref:hypothetical protein n=1 Tax=Parachlamydia sp. AcF125 TaxID=2795736 RepID=UPI001BC9BF7F|nr:hypothetical protein [Parachlamydia sp. AcF125]MBS4167788.1 hypothetical protein [Parachlamydia sp. AcF125]